MSHARGLEYKESLIDLRVWESSLSQMLIIQMLCLLSSNGRHFDKISRDQLVLIPGGVQGQKRIQMSIESNRNRQSKLKQCNKIEIIQEHLETK